MASPSFSSSSGSGGGDSGGSGDDDTPRRIEAAIQQQAQQHQQGQFMAFVQTYGLNLLFPAEVHPPKDSSNKKKIIKTNKDLINARLLENGILFEDLQSLPQVQAGVQRVVDNLMRTQAFHSVQVQVDKTTTTTTNETYREDNGQQQSASSTTTQDGHPHRLKVILDEKNWYSLYIGGGIKHEGMEEAMNGGGGGGSSGSSLLPKAQFESSVSLNNLTGFLDRSTLQYTLDQTSAAQFVASHERPLYSWFPEESVAAQSILSMLKGSQYSLGVKAIMDTHDFESTRSYKEHQRLLQCRLDNVGGVARPEMAPTGGNLFDDANNANANNGDPPRPYWCVDWTLCLRDVVPRKDATLPYCADASPEVVAQAGPSLQHSVKWEVRTNGCYTDSKFQPTIGLDFYGSAEVAGPPGDVGYAKAQGGGALHVPIVHHLLSLHSSWSGGILQPLTYNGLCSGPTISDRFFVGGPMQLRGFLPAGIGPRSNSGGKTSPGGDAMGGNLYYTASIAASMVPPGNNILADYGIRLFAFANAGTVVGGVLPTFLLGGNGSNGVGGPTLLQIIQSTRTSAGVGISGGTPMGRVELTYAWPLRYGPRDARRNLQFGFGFSFG